MENHFDSWQFFNPSARPVSADSHISWADFKTMHVEKHKQGGERRLPTPVWAVNDIFLRKLLTVFMEARLKILDPRGTLNERRERVRVTECAQLARQLGTLNELNHAYVATKDPARKKELEIEIENLDTAIRIARRGGTAVVAAVVYLYHRARLDSVAVAAELSIKPPHVRQIIWKLDHLWAKRFNPDRTERPRVVKPRITFDKRNTKEALRLRREGLSYEAIAVRMGASRTGVRAVIRKAKGN